MKVWVAGITAMSLITNLLVVLPAKAALEEFNEPAIAVIGQADFTSTAGATTQTGFELPYGVDYDDQNDRLFVVDAVNNRVLVYDGNPGTLSTFSEPAIAVIGQASYTASVDAVTQTGMSAPIGIAYDPVNERLFVAQVGGYRITVYDVDPDTLSTFSEPAIAVIGQASYTASVDAVTQTGISGATQLAYDAANARLFLSDFARSGVTVYDVDPGTLSTFSEPAIAVIGQASYTASVDAVTQTGMNNPLGIAYDNTDERLFVADSNHSRITVYDASTVGLAEFSEPAIAVIGQASYTANGQMFSQIGTGFPWGIAYDDANDRLFVGNTYASASRITVYDASTGGLAEFSEPAFSVIGQNSYTGTDNGVVSQTRMDGVPYGIAYDAGDDRLFVSDGEDARVMVFDFGTTDPTTSNSLAMSRLKTNEVSTVSLSFDLANALSSTLTVTFPADFTILSAALANPESSACLSNFQFSNVTKTVSADKTSCGPGTITLGGFTVQNPATPGSYTIFWVNDDPGEAIVAIVDDDQVTVTATIDPSITFDLDTAVADTETGAGYFVPLGVLSPGTVKSSGTTINSIWADLDTNASGGAIVTVLSQNGADGLASLSVPGDTIPNAPGTMASGTANYGLCVISATQTAGTFQRGADYVAGTCAVDGLTNDVKALSDVTPSPILDSDSGPIDGGRARVSVNANVTTLTAAHSDYSDILTFVATGTF